MVTETKPKPLPRIQRPSNAVLIPGELLVLVVDLDIPADLTTNQLLGRHWSHKHKAKQCSNQAVEAAIANLRHATPGGYDLPPFPERPYRFHVTIGLGKGRKRADDDNYLIALKWARDLIAESIGIDDRYFRQQPIDVVRDQAGLGWIAFKIMPEEKS